MVRQRKSKHDTNSSSKAFENAAINVNSNMRPIEQKGKGNQNQDANKSPVEEGPIVHHLNGRSYSLTPSRRKQQQSLSTSSNSQIVSQILRIIKTVCRILSLPFVLVLAMLFTVIMYCSPPKVRSYLLSLYLPQVLQQADTLFYQERCTLLQESISSQQTVLDIGCGTGAYLKFIKHASHIVALEPVKEFHPMIHKEAQRVGIFSDDCKANKKDQNFTLLPYTIEEYFLKLKEMKQQQQNQQSSSTTKEQESKALPLLFDWIILGNILCEVECPKSTLETVNSLLRPGGNVYFSEHIAYSCGSFKRQCQHVVNPWWNLISGGCNVNRDSLQTIHQMKDWKVISWLYSNEDMQISNFIIGSFVLGLAHKQK